MGQGYSLTSISAGAAALDSSELSDLTYERSLGNARFMKTIRARREDGVVVAKLAMKPVQNQNWDPYVKALTAERKALSDIPNAFGYHRIQQTSTTGILTRQFIHSSLYDRISTRPFLDLVEKRWVAFQLLCAVRDAHAKGIHHGDIKMENILVTSWNWVYLTDFSSSYKPTYLPEDNPADFSFYFDTSGRRTCYLAPERFLKNGEDASKAGVGMNWSMDIFSTGCVIAELFLETPIFNLSQLLRYRAGDYDPSMALEDIKDADVREMISHMIQLDPQARYAADEYLNFWRGKAFPEYFSSFLHQYMHLITDPAGGRRPITNGTENLGESDDRIDRVYNDFDKIAFFLGYNDNSRSGHVSNLKASQESNALFPLQIDIPNHRHMISAKVDKPSDNGSLLFLTLVEASLRSTARAAPRMKAIELLLAFAERVPDEVKLDRILPYLMDMLNEDQTEPVRIYALRAVTQLLELVQTITAQNAYVFTEYILPRVGTYVIAPKKNPSTALRATYASCLASLATTALRFLEMMQALRMGGTALAGDPEHSAGSLTFTTLTQLYDTNRADLLSYFEVHTTGLLEDTETSVRRAFLGSISTLCFAFGSAKASDVVLSHLNTYLNDRDWQLKCAFFETIVGVATYVGSAPLEEYMLPLMVQALTDPEETVVEWVLRSFSAIAELGLFQKSTLWELVDIVARFTMHPNMCIREAAAFFISSATKFLSVADKHSIILPLIRVYLKTLPSKLTELVLLDALKKSLPRVVFDLAIMWAQRTENGSFWKAARMQHTFTFGGSSGSGHALQASAGKDHGPRALSRIPQNEEDHAWLQRLRTAGMTGEDEFKLVALREFIARVAQRKANESSLGEKDDYGGVTRLSDLGITPQLVFFDKEEDILNQHAVAPVELEERRKTIAEALADAREDRLSGLGTPKPAYGGEGSSGTATPIGGVDIPVPKGLKSPLSEQAASSADSRPSIASERRHHVRRKGSSISLIGGGKTKAEAVTTVENAVGKVDTSTPPTNVSRRSTQLTIPSTVDRRSSSHPRIRPTHSYRGHDPTVLRLLDAMYLEKYPQDLIDFGPLVARRQNKPIKRVGGSSTNATWKPEGTLVAMLNEHTDAVTRIAVAPNHTFFITGSDDGTVKIWDTQRLERNITNRSRQTHKQGEGVKITALTFVEDTNCFVSCGSDGSVYIVRVDYVLKDEAAQSSSGRYGRLRIVREHSLPHDEHVTWCEQFREDHKSFLLLSTNKCRILALELRSMEVLYELRNPVRHGVPLCFCVDKKRHWLVVGTSHGVLDLWDLRFRIRLKAYAFPGGAPVYRMTLIPTPRPKSKQLKIAVTGGTGQPEITVWDIEKLVCTNVYRAGIGITSKEITASYKLAEIDEDHPTTGMLSRFSTTSKSDAGATSVAFGGSIRALSTGLSTLEGSEPRGYHFFLTAGPDWKVRFWDTSRPESSTVVSGMELEEGKPSYTISQPSPELQIVNERLNPASSSAGNVDGGSGQSTPRKEGRRSKSSVISMQAQVLLKTHLDMIMDVAFLECPYGMVVSGDRSGVVYVFS